MRYRPEIDGLRTLAVLPVILFHAKIAGFSGGFVGVDVFFVISGYLITRILAREMAEGRYSLWRFYERRARRILPALVVMMLVSTVIAWRVLPPLEMQWFGQSVLATSLFAANFYFLIRGRDYFSGQTAEYPLLHTWSLAVEEQFYIVFPLLLWLLWRYGPKRVFWVIVALSGASLLLAEGLSRIDQGINFYLLPSRAWELGAGAICALLHERPEGRRERPLLAAVGLVLIVGSVFGLHEGLRFPSLWAVPPVLGTALVILYAGPGCWTGRMLSVRPMVAVGLASYSTYLWHQPLFAFTHVHLNGDPPVAVMLALSALSVGLGFLSLHFVEAPFRRRGTIGSKQVVAVAGGVLAVCVGVGLALHLSLGAAGRIAAAHLPDDYYAAVAKPAFPERGQGLQSCTDFCVVHAPQTPSARVALVGDSHAQDLIAPMIALAEARDWELSLFINTGCSYTRLNGRRGDCRAADKRLAAASWQAYDAVYLVNRFSGLMEDLSPAERRAALDDYGDLVRAILAGGAEVTLFVPRPMISTDPIRAALAGDADRVGIRDSFAASAEWQSFQAGLAALPGVRIADQPAFLYSLDCGAEACFSAHTATGYPLYRDVHHLSPWAAQQLIPWLEANPPPPPAG
jgi:peptidoglycan/LPS O-acetylase OafA/YrhL